MGVMNNKFQILIVEDEAEAIEFVRVVLEREGYKVLSADNGVRGLEVMKQEKPDLVLLDLMMPNFNGWDVYRAIKADNGLAKIPVIVLTAKPQGIDKEFGLQEANVDDYIIKPFHPRDLLKSIERVLKGRKWE